MLLAWPWIEPIAVIISDIQAVWLLVGMYQKAAKAVSTAVLTLKWHFSKLSKKIWNNFSGFAIFFAKAFQK